MAAADRGKDLRDNGRPIFFSGNKGRSVADEGKVYSSQVTIWVDTGWSGFGETVHRRASGEERQGGAKTPFGAWRQTADLPSMLMMVSRPSEEKL